MNDHLPLTLPFYNLFADAVGFVLPASYMRCSLSSVDGLGTPLPRLWEDPLPALFAPTATGGEGRLDDEGHMLYLLAATLIRKVTEIPAAMMASIANNMPRMRPEQNREHVPPLLAEVAFLPPR